MGATVKDKPIAHPTDCRLLEVALCESLAAAQGEGIQLKQAYIEKGKRLHWKVVRYRRARQFRRMLRAVARQHTIADRLICEIECKMPAELNAGGHAGLHDLLQRAERIGSQRARDKAKLYALHAPETECIAKGKARKRYDFGVKDSFAVTQKTGLIVRAQSFPGNLYEGDVLAEQLEQGNIQMQIIRISIKPVVVNLDFRDWATDHAKPEIDLIHPGKIKDLTKEQRKALKRRQAVKPLIGRLMDDHDMHYVLAQRLKGRSHP